MCLSCGCAEPDDDHGNPDHITWTDLRKASRAADISPAQAAENIRSGTQSLGTPPS